jgi:hypothetical protein
MENGKSKSGRGAAVLLIVCLLLIGGAVAAEYFGLIHVRDTLRPYYEMLVSDPERAKVYLEEKIMPIMTVVGTIVTMVMALLSPVIKRMNRSATMFDSGTRAAVVSMETAEASREENRVFQEQQREEVRAALEEMKIFLKESIDEQSRIIREYDERAERTEEKVDRLTRMEITAIKGSSELTRKNVAAKAVLIGREEVPSERRAKEARRADAANAEKGGVEHGRQV